jgi:hypothetical protein
MLRPTQFKTGIQFGSEKFFERLPPELRDEDVEQSRFIAHTHDGRTRINGRILPTSGQE